MKALVNNEKLACYSNMSIVVNWNDCTVKCDPNRPAAAHE